MRLIEIEIHNIRGICDLLLKPDGKNLVVWGQNGSGKSALVDAIDFLLTGRISRLTGKGTGDIKLDRHGTHITHDPKEAIVRAVISIPSYPKPIEVKRCIATPGNLEYSDPTAKKALSPILAIASRGQHVLTRREILKYITAEPNNRAQEIQAILDLKEIEEIRGNLITVQNTCKKEFEGTKKALGIAQGTINGIVNEKTFNVGPILECINKNRGILGASPITEINSAKLKANLTPPVFLPKEKTINVTQLKQDIESIKGFYTEASRATFFKTDEELRNSIELINKNPVLLKSLKRLKLMQLGIELIDETGACPLCDTPWKHGELGRHIEQHLSEAKSAQKGQNTINAKSQILSEMLSNILARIKNVMAAAVVVGLADEKTKLESWSSKFEDLIQVLTNPLEKYASPEYMPDKLERILFIHGSDKILDSIYVASESKYTKITPELAAWDILTKLETSIGSYEKTMELCAQNKLVYDRSVILYESFISSRNKILKDLYDKVRDRFVELYRYIHGTDESKFTAEIEPDEAGLDFKVDFYGHGTHPPHALHSEGHQDSMGICLYLALSERLTKGIVDLIILDDVVMSVDVDHRRQICDLLAKSFPNNQFLITTHDRTWANQLRMTNIVDSKGLIQFYNWHVDTGPQIDFEADVWPRIDNDLKKDDVSSASAKLRHNAEQFFAIVCDALQAPVVYSLSGSYDFGNLLNGAVGQYNKLLGKAQKSAQSWGKNEEFEQLQEFGSIAKSIYIRTNAESWAINPSIHYNNWANLSKTEFEPVVDAFKDLYGVFACSKCGGIIHVVPRIGNQEAIRCNCTQINWNLVPKENITK